MNSGIEERLKELAKEMRGFGGQRFNHNDETRKEVCDLYADKIESILVEHFSSVAAGKNPLKILTTTTKPDYPAWGEQTEMLPGWNEEAQRAWKSKQSAGIVADLRWAFRLLSASRRYDVVITGFERAAWLFALLRRFLFISGPPHIFLDAHPVLAGNRFVRAIRRFVFRQVFLSAESVVVFSVKQRRLWADLFDISDDKFSVIPYWATASVEQAAESTLGDYVFAGGDEERDYKTLIQAMERLPYRLVIAALRRDHFEGVTIPPNVEIVTVAHAEFMRLLSGAGAVVVPLKKDTIRYAGQQTYLNAMLFAKPVLVACEGAGEYIKDGETGCLSMPGDILGMSSVIMFLMSSPKAASEIGINAQRAAREFTADKYFGGIFALARRCASIHTLGIPNQSTRECEQ